MNIQLLFFYKRFVDNYNVAYKKPTSQSGVVKNSSLATDGSRMDSHNEMCSLTTRQKDPWWRVDLENQVLVREVYIYIYSNSEVDYLIEIRVGNHDAPSLKENYLCGDSYTLNTHPWRRIGCPVPLLGRYVSITRLVDNGDLKLCEVEVREESKLHIYIRTLTICQNWAVRLFSL